MDNQQLIAISQEVRYFATCHKIWHASRGDQMCIKTLCQRSVLIMSVSLKTDKLNMI